MRRAALRQSGPSSTSSSRLRDDEPATRNVVTVRDMGLDIPQPAFDRLLPMAMRRVLTVVAVLAFAALPAVLVPSAAARSTSKQLTGFGATKAAWMRHHRVDPRFAPFAFFPRQANGEDRYVNVHYSNGRVDSYEMNFAPKESRRQVVAAIRPDLPPDARIAYDRRKRTCEFVAYRSRLLGRLVGDRLVVFELLPTATGSPPYRGTVADVLVGADLGPSVGC